MGRAPARLGPARPAWSPWRGPPLHEHTHTHLLPREHRGVHGGGVGVRGGVRSPVAAWPSGGRGPRERGGGTPSILWEPTEAEPQPSAQVFPLIPGPQRDRDYQEPQNGKPRCSPSAAPFQSASLLKWTLKAAGNPCPSSSPWQQAETSSASPARTTSQIPKAASSVLRTPGG